MVARESRWALAAVLSLAVLLCSACGPSGSSPVLENLRCAEEGACQSEADPFLLRLAVDFRDDDGDLGSGTFTVFVDDSISDGPTPLLQHFEEAELSPYATEGSVVLPAGLQISGMRSGMVFIVAIEVTDHAGNRSNRPGMEFELTIE